MSLAVGVYLLGGMRGDWRNFEKYYPTLLYETICNVAYKVISLSQFHLWKARNDIMGDTLAFFYYTFFALIPGIFLYLSNYPDSIKKQIFHTLPYTISYLWWFDYI